MSRDAHLRPATPDPLLAFLPRGRAWLLGGVLLGAAVGAGLHAAAPPQSRSTVAVELTKASASVDLSAWATRPKYVSVDTDAQLLLSDEVVDAVSAAVGEPAPVVRDSLHLRARQLTRVIEITYSSASSETSRAGATRAAEAFLAARERLVIHPVREYLVEVGAATRAAEPVPASDVDIVFSDEDVRVEDRLTRAMELELSLPGAGRVLEDAPTTAQAVRSDVEVPVASGAAAGGLLGLGLGMARDRRSVGRARAARPAFRRIPAAGVPA